MELFTPSYIHHFSYCYILNSLHLINNLMFFVFNIRKSLKINYNNAISLSILCGSSHHIVLLPRDWSLKDRNIFSYLTLQSLQQGPVAHSASVVSLQVIGSQQGSYSLHSSIDPQSHCSPSSITLFPHDLLISNYNPKQIPNRLS